MDGKWVIYGSMGGVKLESTPMIRLLMQRASILTSTLRNRTDQYKADLFQETFDYFTAHKMEVVVDRTFKMTEIEQAHEYVEAN
jgi:NADPH:quinone reductase-like Zn-dependent oxidoreductase